VVIWDVFLSMATYTFIVYGLKCWLSLAISKFLEALLFMCVRSNTIIWIYAYIWLSSNLMLARVRWIFSRLAYVTWHVFSF
jgi:hydrogenase-4 membrane subunit HyfE